MDILITIAFLTLYYILGLGTVITLKTGLEEDVKLISIHTPAKGVTAILPNFRLYIL